jgi:hypothetical protein
VAESSKIGEMLGAIFWWSLIGAGAIAYVYNFKVEDYKPDCDMERICSDYKTQRNACATAGSYQKCMSIKMGSPNFSTAEAYCSEDGSLAYKPKNTPNIFVCTVAWGKNLLK